MRNAFAKKVIDLCNADKNTVLVVGDFCFGMFDTLKGRFPRQYFNLGTAEQSMVGIAAGMAIGGLRPIVYAITPFLLERAFEQIKLDVDQQKLPVILVGFDDYAHDGPTHIPLAPRAMVSLLPNTRYVEPLHADQVEAAVDKAVASGEPTFIRLRNNPKTVPVATFGMEP